MYLIRLRNAIDISNTQLLFLIDELVLPINSYLNYMIMILYAFIYLLIANNFIASYSSFY